MVNNICAICIHVSHIGFNNQGAPYLEIKYLAMVIIGLQVLAYDIVGACIATQTILDTQLHACIKLPSSYTVYSEFIILTYIIMTETPVNTLVFVDCFDIISVQRFTVNLKLQ